MKKTLLSLGVLGVFISSAVAAQEKPLNFYAGVGYGTVAVPEDDEISFSDADNGFIQLGYKLSENFSIEGQYSKSVKDAKATYIEEGINVTDEWWESILEMNPGTTLNEIQGVFPYAVIDLAVNIDASIETSAIYGVYRSSGDLYFKVKAGYLSEKTTLTIKPSAFDFYAEVLGNAPIVFTAAEGDEEFDDFGQLPVEKVSDKESDFSGGVGVGYKLTNRFFSELEYTMLNDDLDMYSLSINFAF